MSDSAIIELQNLLGLIIPSPEQRIIPAWSGAKDYTISVKRDDMLHPIISGNKWRKLKYVLINAQQKGIKHLISFGGGHSNHLHALAYCCHKLDIKLCAIIRGDYSNNLTAMLQDIIDWGAEINWVNRVTYQRRDEPAYLQTLKHQYPQALIIPEGGSQSLALDGVAEIVSELNQQYDYIVTPVGSGGTLAGLIHASQQSTSNVLGVAVLKGQGYLEQLVTALLPGTEKQRIHWTINHDFHFGGYAKKNQQLATFCADFSQQTGLPVEPVYSGKMFYALQHLIQQRAFPLGSKILALHTGGLQGNRG